MRRTRRPRRTTRPPVRARSASRVAVTAVMVEGTNARATVTIRPGSWKARGAACTSSWCEATALNAPNAASTPTTAKACAADCSTTVPSMGPPTVNPPMIRGKVACGSVNQTSSDVVAGASVWVVRAVSTTRTTANTTPRVTRMGKALARVPSRRCALTTRKAMAVTSAT